MNKIIENFKYVVFKNYATFEGRARRSEYWYFVLASIIISFILGLIEGVAVSTLEIRPLMSNPNESGLANIYSLLVLVPSIAAGVRRLHDSNKSGWWLLLPFYNLYLLIIKGTEGPNRFGPDQLAPTVAPIPPAQTTPTPQA